MRSDRSLGSQVRLEGKGSPGYAAQGLVDPESHWSPFSSLFPGKGETGFQEGGEETRRIHENLLPGDYLWGGELGTEEGQLTFLPVLLFSYFIFIFNS